VLTFCMVSRDLEVMDCGELTNGDRITVVNRRLVDARTPYLMKLRFHR
jgi:hypothetical protein